MNKVKKHLFSYIFLFLPFLSFCQNDVIESEFKHFSIIKRKDTINYHIYSKGELADKKNFIVYFQGSGSRPWLQIIDKTDTIKSNENDEIKIEKYKLIYNFNPFDLNKIPEDDAFVVISKKSIPFLIENENFKTPKTFYETESLDYRAWQGDQVIKQILKKHIKHPKKIIVMGHSEGSDVVAKLGTVNKSITHIGFWSGGGNTQYYDFTIFINKQVEKGIITEIQGKEKLDSLFEQLTKIVNNENSIIDFWEDHTFRRWTKFSEPPIDNLLKINIPLFVAASGKDESVPIESAYLIPIEFIRHNKNNLTFKMYPDYDHSFMVLAKNDGKEDEYHWMEVFQDFIRWTNEN